MSTDLPFPPTPAAPPAPSSCTPEGRPTCYAPDSILTQEEVAAVLGVSVKTVQRHAIRRCYLSQVIVRYFFRDVVAYLDERAA